MNFERMPQLKWACGYDFGVGVPALNKFCQSLGGALVFVRPSDAPLVAILRPLQFRAIQSM